MLTWTDAQGLRRRRVLSGDRRTAEQVRNEVIKARDLEAAGLGALHGQELLLSEIRDRYLCDLKDRATPRHHRGVQLRLDRALAELGCRQVRDLRAAAVLSMRGRMKAAGMSHRTLNTYVGGLRAMLAWAAGIGLILENPLRTVKPLPTGPDHQRYKRRALSEKEVARFLSASEEDDADNDLRASLEGMNRVPQTILWQLLIETGMRWGEARQLRWGDIDFKRKLVTLRAETTKARRQRVIPIRESLLARLQTLRALHEQIHARLPTVQDHVLLSPEGLPHSWASSNPMRVFDRVLARAKIAKNGPEGKLDIHALRHCAASRMARAGVPVMQAARLLGHADVRTTSAIYAHLDAEDLRGAVNALPELGAATKEDHAPGASRSG